MHRFAGRKTAALLIGLIAAVLAAGCGSSSKSSTPATSATTVSSSSGTSAKATGSPITIGYISDLTGVASSTFADGPGAAQAIIDATNAKGGVNGHPLKLVVKDDASTTTGNATAAEELVQSDHAMVILDYSSFAFAGAPYLAKAGIPVIGSAFDGPEWADYPNMFTWAVPAESPIHGTYYTYTNLGNWLKDVGATSFGGLGYGISPSSTLSIVAAEKSASAEGIRTCYTNNTVSFGAVNFATDVLQIKGSNCGSIAGSFVEASDLALSTAMKQGGLGGVKQIYFTGYDAATTATAADSAAFTGDYVDAAESFSPPNAAGTAFLNTIKEYDKSYPGGIPDFGALGSAISAQLAVYGLSLAGANPTSASFTKALRGVSSWNDNGLLPSPIGFTGFGTAAMFPQTACLYVEQWTGSTWVTYHNAPVCGTRIAFKSSTS
jgi:branched-chain amino acid transport system substrate-binding protein